MPTLERNLHILETKIRDLVNRHREGSVSPPEGEPASPVPAHDRVGGALPFESADPGAWTRERDEIRRRIGVLLDELKPFIE
jgi:hypothetical protein